MVNSTLAMIISGIFKGKKFDMIRNGKIVTIMLDGDPNSKIVIDTSTGLVWDLTISNGFQYKGAVSQNAAYCYHDQLTDNIANQLSKLIPALENRAKSVLSALGGAINGTQKFIVKNWEYLQEDGFKLGAIGVGLATVGSGVIGSLSLGLVLYAEGDLAVSIRNHYLPREDWRYASYHPGGIMGPYSIKAYIDPHDHCIHYIEVPKERNGNLSWWGSLCVINL